MKVQRTTAFKKAFKKLNAKDQGLVEELTRLLVTDETLDFKYKDHALVGNWEGFRSAHVRPDLLLIYQKNDEELVLLLAALGKHSKLY